MIDPQASLFFYAAQVLRVVDGDTFHAKIDLGFRTFVEMPVRIYGVNAAELHAKEDGERALAERAKAWLVEQIQGQAVVLKSVKLEKYGRALAIVYFKGVDVGAVMLDSGITRRAPDSWL